MLCLLVKGLPFLSSSPEKIKEAFCEAFGNAVVLLTITSCVAPVFFILRVICVLVSLNICLQCHQCLRRMVWNWELQRIPFLKSIWWMWSLTALPVPAPVHQLPACFPTKHCMLSTTSSRFALHLFPTLRFSIVQEIECILMLALANCWSHYWWVSVASSVIVFPDGTTIYTFLAKDISYVKGVFYGPATWRAPSSLPSRRMQFLIFFRRGR